MDLTREALKRETGSIDSGGDLRVYSGDLKARNGDFRNSQVHLNSPVSHFLHEYHLFCVNRRIHVYWRIGIMRVTISGHREHFWMLRNRHELS